jgi:SAM-dependent MidA family methyltransferase
MSLGVISFEEFMHRALYDPVSGYYARRIQGVGRRGDFTTVPVFSDSLARALAAWIVRSMHETGCRNVIEIGPGEGQMAAAIRGYLPWRARVGLRYHLVEISAPLKAIQQQKLGGRVRWHASLDEALKACRGCAVLYSNELVDAFPVRRFCRTEDGWREIGVWQEAGLLPKEVLLPAGPLPDSSAFRMDHPLGQIIEVHHSYRRWLDDWLPWWKRGRMLTIDYGGMVENLFHRRPRGTVRGYWMQQRREGLEIYQNIGRQDLTADVNFTDLREWADAWSQDQLLATLRDFCGRHAPAWMHERDGVGEAFLVLDQRRSGGG